MHEVAVLGDADTALGFRLAGVSKAVACSEADADERINELLDDERVGLVLLQEDFAKAFSHKTRKRVDASAKPVVLSIPGKGVSKKGSASPIAAMIKRAIGIDLSAGK